MALEAFLRLSVLAILPPARDLQIDPASTTNRNRNTTLSIVVKHGDYALLGCYGRLRPGASLEVFDEDVGYITLIPVPRDQSTTSSCLEGCAASVPRGTTDGGYPRVAVSEGRCLCGMNLSERMLPVNWSLCDTPCDGNPGISCGGSDYALVYAHSSCPDLETTSQARAGAALGNSNGGRRRCPRNTDTMVVLSPYTTISPSSATQAAGSSTSASAPAFTSTFTTGGSAPASPTVPSLRDDTTDGQFPPGTIQTMLSSTDTKSTVAVVLASVTLAAVLAALALLLCVLLRRRCRRRRLESNPRRRSESSLSRRETALEHDGTDEKPEAAPQAYAVKGPSPRLDASAAHRHSHTSAPTSGSDSHRQSYGVQKDASSAAGDTEPSGTASPTILSVSHIVVRPVAGGVSIIDTSGPNRRYSMPASTSRGGLRRPSARG